MSGVGEPTPLESARRFATLTRIWERGRAPVTRQCLKGANIGVASP
jgi:hypothetical protein